MMVAVKVGMKTIAETLEVVATPVPAAKTTPKELDTG
jgi:hypothetical protein